MAPYLKYKSLKSIEFLLINSPFTNVLISLTGEVSLVGVFFGAVVIVVPVTTVVLTVTVAVVVIGT